MTTVQSGSIDSAPRDGTVILVWASGYNESCPFRMRWRPYRDNPLGYRDAGSPETGLWESDCGGFTWTESNDGGPTHWRRIVVNS